MGVNTWLWARAIVFTRFIFSSVILNRRQFVFVSAASGIARGQTVPPYSAEMPDMLLTYFARRLRDRAMPSAIRTLEQAALRNRSVQAKMREMAGPLPSKLPLAARATRIIERKGYRIENVLFQSRPDYWVPANVYVPTATPGPFPAVVLQRGHFDSVRMSPDYQQLHVDLVRNGFVVLAYDSIGQGERRQYYGTHGEDFEELLSPTLEHCVIGGLLSLIGESAAGWFIWDGMRAVDYLMERPEVDRKKIGCADHTDTGWNVLFHCALDERIGCASIHAHGRGKRWPAPTASWNTTDDPEQFLFPAALYGIDLPDAMAAVAPRPLQVLVEDQSGDFDNVASDLRLRFRQLGVAEKFAVEKAKSGEDWPRALRNATVRWFSRWLRGDDGTALETELTPEPYSALNATPKGSLRESNLGQPIYSIIRERARELPPAREPSGEDLVQLKNDIRAMLGGPASVAPAAREVSSDRLDSYILSRVEFLSEPGIYIPARVYRPIRPKGECILYTAGDVTTLVHEADDDGDGPSAAEEKRDPAHDFADALASKGHTVLIVDVRGLGLTEPAASRRDLRGPYEHLHNSDVALANMAWSLGDSLFAMRVRDLLQAVTYASQFGRVRLAATDMGALWALCAAAVDPRVTGVAVQRGLASYRMLTEHDRYMHASSQFLIGVLRRFDLPQVAGAIAPRPLTILDPTDHMKMPLDPQAAERNYSWTRAAYTAANAAERLRFVFHENLEQYAGA
jgi:hypothetical protein